MLKIDLRQNGDDLVVYYQPDYPNLNVYMFGAVLVALANCPRLGGRSGNLTNEFVISVEELALGQFRATLRPSPNRGSGRSPGPTVQEICLRLIEGLIGRGCLAPPEDITVDMTAAGLVLANARTRLTFLRPTDSADREWKAGMRLKYLMEVLLQVGRLRLADQRS